MGREKGLPQEGTGALVKLPRKLIYALAAGGTSTDVCIPHWLPTSAFTLPGTSTKVCVRGPGCRFASVVPIAGTTIIYLTCLDSLPCSCRPAGTKSQTQFKNGTNQTNLNANLKVQSLRNHYLGRRPSRNRAPRTRNTTTQTDCELCHAFALTNSYKLCILQMLTNSASYKLLLTNSEMLDL